MKYPYDLSNRRNLLGKARLFFCGLQVVAAAANEDARAAALSELLVRLVMDSLTEYAYDAYVAELQYDLKFTDTGFQVAFVILSVEVAGGPNEVAPTSGFTLYYISVYLGKARVWTLASGHGVLINTERRCACPISLYQRP